MDPLDKLRMHLDLLKGDAVAMRTDAAAIVAVRNAIMVLLEEILQGVEDDTL